MELLSHTEVKDVQKLAGERTSHRLSTYALPLFPVSVLLSHRLLTGKILQSPQASGLVKSIQGRLSPRYETNHQRVMINGDAGKGKPFLLNNVLGYRDLSAQV